MQLELIDRKKIELAKLKRKLKIQLASCFRADDPESRPTPKQEDIFRDQLHNVFYVIGSNRSGKTAWGAREVSWWFQGLHPYKERRAEWGDNPLQILVMAQTDKNAENEIWTNKLKPLLLPGEYKEVRVGASLQRVENLENGNVIIFFSHHNANQARKAVQGFTAHIVWVDEMPESSRLLAELITRTVTSKGYMFATFTPLVENEEIRKIVDRASDGSVKYKLSLFDNPAIQDRLEEVVESIRSGCATESELKARLYGDWYYSKRRVFSYEPDKHMRPLPKHYSTLWRHVSIVDPAASGLAGLTVWAEDPIPAEGEPRWYCVLSEYVEGDAAFEQVEAIEERIAPLTVVLRGCDCNPAGFYKEANSPRRRLGYVPFKDKKDRKEETIQDFNTFLVSGEGVLTPAAEVLHDELLNCKRAEESDKIQKESTFHTADSARYFVQLKPPPSKRPTEQLTGSAAIRAQWHARRETETKRKLAEKKKAEFKFKSRRRSKWKRLA